MSAFAVKNLFFLCVVSFGLRRLGCLKRQSLPYPVDMLPEAVVCDFLIMDNVHVMGDRRFFIQYPAQFVHRLG
jgi:hypothetical protein